MKIFRFDAEVGRQVEQFGSTKVVLSNIARLSAESQVSCMHIGPVGRIGDHPAIVPQLFVVVKGEGWVRSEMGEPLPIRAGQAAFWEAGEGHAAGSTNGMTAIVIESSTLDPGEMAPL
jgi:quercetin dioxygenase-like cupin family protein